VCASSVCTKQIGLQLSSRLSCVRSKMLQNFVLHQQPSESAPCLVACVLYLMLLLLLEVQSILNTN
jgi:hypothetical protein